MKSKVLIEKEITKSNEDKANKSKIKLNESNTHNVNLEDKNNEAEIKDSKLSAYKFNNNKTLKRKNRNISKEQIKKQNNLNDIIIN